MQQDVTLIPPEPRDSLAAAVSSGLPADLLRQSAERLRTVALMYAFIFFMAGVFPALLIPGDRARFFSTPLQWLPSVVGIAVAVLLTLVIRRVPLETAMRLGLGLRDTTFVLAG